jgi:hypothetical protein
MAVKQITLNLSKRHAGQEKIRELSQAHRFIVLPCGRRFGKTEETVTEAIETALKGQKYGYWCPDFNFADEFWRRLKIKAEPIIKRKDETKKRLETITGGSIQCFSLHDGPDAGRSLDFDRAAIDEAGLIPCLLEAWTDTIRPALMDRKGRASFRGTPKGRNDFYTLYTWALDETKPDWGFYSAKTGDNPYIPRSEIVEMQPPFISERSYRQEICAEFLQDGGGVFGDVRRLIQSGVERIEPSEGRVYRAGIDLAKSQDFTVVSVMDSTGQQVCIERWNQVPWPETQRRVKAVLDRYNAVGIVDSTGVGDPIFDELRRMGCRVKPFQFTQRSREHLLERLQMACEGEEIKLLDHQGQRTELEAFEWVMRGKTIRAEVPSSVHDDLVMALALSVSESKPRQVFIE